MADKAKKDSKALNAELENALFDDVERCELFFTQHWKPIVAVALAVVVAITAAFALHTRSARRNLAAAERLSAAVSIADLEKALTADPDAPGADMARYRLAGKYIDSKEYDKALKTLAVISAGPDKTLRGKARMVEAYVYELTGKTAEAARKFLTLSSSSELPPAGQLEASYAAGRLCIKLGRKDEAKSVLNKAAAIAIPQESPSAWYWKSQVTELLRCLD